MESERSGPALEGDLTLAIDQVEAVGPRCVNAFGRVAKLVQNCGNLNPKLTHTCSGDGSALVLVAWAGENYFVFDIALHLPDVAGMRLSNVDHEERDLILILMVELVEGRNLPPERWSGVAAEDEHDWLALCG